MPLQKQSLNINFQQGLDLKTDPFQVQPGKFLSLQNAVFTKGGLLKKRFGFQELPTLPVTTCTFATVFNQNLTAIGSTFYAYSESSQTWVNRGSITPIDLSVLSLVRSSSNQTQVDSVVASNGLVCTAFTDVGSSTSYKYCIAESATGQLIVAPTAITPSSGSVSGSPRVFVLGRYFIIVFTVTITATPHLQYIAININNPTLVTAAADISATYTPASTVAWDGVVTNNCLYLAWNGSDIGGAIRVAYLDATLTLHSAVTFATRVATIMSLAADASGSSSVIWVTFYDSGSSTGYTLAVNPQLLTILAPTQIIASGTVLNITSTSTSGNLRFYYEISNTYSFGGATNFIRGNTCTQAGTVGSSSVIVRSVGLASKAFTMGGLDYFLTAYSTSYQPSYFLVDSSGQVVSKLAYSNGGGYLTLGLPAVTVDGTNAQIAYRIKDRLEPVNKTQGAANSLPVFAQTGANLATFTFSSDSMVSAEIGASLNLSGGFLWMYDGVKPVEQGFHVWPDALDVATATTGGNLTAQIYYYVALYEWTDNQGNIYRSAPSVPMIKDISASGTSTNKNTIQVGTLRLTYKITSPVKIVIYRWSTAQQTYYQVTSLSSPLLNDTTVDKVSFEDTLADSSIIGNSILYTTGGVVENIAAPACRDVSLFKSRLVVVYAEDNNVLGYSKQVVQGTPVEMSDLFTQYASPTTSAQGSTGGVKCTAPMDDKLILFKSDAAYYITGTGPDNTGANNDFSDPIFITSTVGCENKRSIVFIPQGLMFQSDKGIWLLGRDLSTQYIGAPVEDFNQYTVLSAVNVPGTNQVRFTLSNGTTLMYDYFYNQWGTFVGIPAISSTLFGDLHTFIDQYGKVFQENPGSYLDGSRPVLLSFTTSWLNLAGLQGFQRAYSFFLLGTYYSPHKLGISIAYDYAPGPSQFSVLSPDNYSPAYGGDTLYGGSSVYGGAFSLENWQVFFQRQKCESFQITVDEMFDPSFGTIAGQGLTLSGLDILIGMKGGSPKLKASNSIG